MLEGRGEMRGEMKKGGEGMGYKRGNLVGLDWTALDWTGFN